MAQVMPKGEKVRKAVKWISENLRENPAQPLQRLINDAVLRFDLSHGDSELVIDFYRKEKE